MRIKHLFYIFIIFLNAHWSLASHIMGGEITWTCAGPNTYQFQLVIYRDCNGLDIVSNNLDIEVWGHPSVSTINCQLIQTIDLSPPCTETVGGPIQLDCGTGASGGNGPGAIEKYIFQSAPTVLTGVPPASGWSFTYDDWSRSWSLSNIDSPQTYGITLHATMYAHSGTSSGQCVDSSPQFAQDPYMLLCAGTNFEFNSNVYDPDNDSLVFSFGVPYDHFTTGSFNPPSNPIPVPFVPGFSFDNPTPDNTFDANNIPASIDPTTGTVSFTSFTTGEYAIKQKIDTYRNGELIATNNREFQLVIMNCGGSNTAPQITPPFNSNTSFTAEFFAGDVIDFDIIIQDNELLQDGTPQTVTLTPSGNAFGANFTDANNGCGTIPCATLDQSPIISGIQGLTTHFHWETSCDHLLDANGIQQNEQEYTFVLKAQDDYCSVPGLTYKTIIIKLKNSEDLPPTDLNCVNVLPNGDVELNWTKSDPTSGTFTAYEIYTIQDGLVGTINDINIESFTHFGAGADLGSKDYYILTKFGCNGNNSVSSDTLSSIFLDLNDLGDGRVSLTWNNTHNPINNGDQSTQNIMREYPAGVWTLRDVVPYNTTFYQDTIDVCSGWLNYRIEIENDAGCISGSNIDGDQLEDIINPYIPVVTNVTLDTVTDLMEINWNTNAALDTYGYIIYQLIGGFWEPIDTVYGRFNTTYQNINTNASNEAETYGIAAFDSCLTNTTPPNYQTSALSDQHTSIFLSNELDICSQAITLHWSGYEGKTVLSYDIIAKSGNSSYDIIANVNQNVLTYTHENLLQDVTYYYYVRANLENGISSYSNLSQETVIRPSQPNYFYLTTATHTINEEIEVELLVDPNATVNGFEIERKGPYESSYSFISEISPTTSNLYNYFDGDIDSKLGAYMYRINLIDSCGNQSMTTNTGKTIFLTVNTQDTEMKATLQWSPYFGFDGNIIEYRIYRGVNGIFDANPIAIVSPSIRTYVDDLNEFYDSEGEFCYRVEAVESMNSYNIQRTAFSNTVCVVLEPLVYIPNAFTVMGYNPVFLPIVSLYDFDSYELFIYNRWGETIFYSTDQNQGWNGYDALGNLKQEGVYVYHLKFKDGFEQLYEYKGSVTLLYGAKE
ncbi:MAG: T9SS type B sorting domain-containing protein [Putridiphycobacter sp.]